jgi:hypothetical protein
MLSTGTFPTRLKFSQVFPLFKKDDKTEKSDYRPVIFNSLILNLNKIKFIQFSAKYNLGNSICIDYEHNHIENSQSPSFLGIVLDKTLSWQLHIDKICAKLKSACYILRTLNPILSVSNLKTIYFSYIHSIITYGIIFWGNSTGSDEVFKLQKKGPLELLQILIAVPHVVTYLKN